MTEQSRGGRAILWARLDLPGHETAELTYADGAPALRGTAVLADEGRPCRASYAVDCDAEWTTVRATVSAHVGGASRTIELTRSAAGEWRVDGAARPELAGCTDVDLSFSPSTNTLPVRRLRLDVGGRAGVRAAWVRFPELTVEVLEQVYERTGAHAYRYESAGGAFRRDLTVDDEGLVRDYPGLWRAEASVDVGG